MRKIILLSLLVFTFLFTSCAKFPQTEIEQTTSYVDTIKVVGGDVYVPDIYQLLVDSLESVKKLATIEEEKLFSNYKETLKALNSINNIAKDAMVQIEEAKMNIGEVFFIVEEMPIFQDGGEKSLENFRNYIQSNIKYPPIAKENGISGTVYVNFIVNRFGEISNIKVIRSVDPSLDNAVIDALVNSPNWEPGKQRGETVSVSMAIPVKFVLQ